MKEIKQTFVATGLLLLCLSGYFYNKTIFYPPSHIHAWTQSDRLAIALKFTENGFNFFKPQTFNLKTKDGVTAVDFPIQEYAVALLMKFTESKNPFIFRAFNLLCYITGLMFFAVFVAKLSGSNWKGVWMAAFVFTLPVLTYFEAGFIPSPVSFSYLLAGIYFYYQYLELKNARNLYLALGAFTLAALMRTPFSLFLLALIAVDCFKNIREKSVTFKTLLAYVLCMAAFAGFYIHNRFLSREYGNMFLDRFLPATSLHGFITTVKLVRSRWQYQYFTCAHYCIILVYLLLFIFFKRVRKKLSSTDRQLVALSAAMLFTGSVYFLLMTEQYVDHEYYFIDSFYPSIVLFFAILFSKANTGKYKKLEYLALTITIVFAAFLSNKVQADKYADAAWDLREATRKNFIGSKETLDSLGIPAPAKILVIDAYSTNAPLILMNRCGYTVEHTTYESIHDAMQLPFDYIVIQDVSVPSEVMNWYPPFSCLTERIGGNGKISVFKLSHSNKCFSALQLLGINDSGILQESNPVSDSTHWSGIIRRDTSSESILSASRQYGLSFVYQVPTACRVRGILFKAEFLSADSDCNFSVVAQVFKSDSTIFYKELYCHLLTGNEYNAEQFLFLLPEEITPGSDLQCYLLNNMHQNINCKNPDVYLLK